MNTSALIPEDHLLLKCSIEAGASLEALAKGNKKIPYKRKNGSISIHYYRKRRRIKSDSFNSPDLRFFDKCKKPQNHATLNHGVHVGHVMFSDCLANNFGSIATTDLVDKSAHGCHDSVQNVYINGSMREDGLCKPAEMVCFLLRDNLMSFDPGIEPEDDTHMHDKGDSYNTTAVTGIVYASHPDSLLSFSDNDHIVCSLNTEDTVDDIPNSQLLDSPEYASHPDSPLSFSDMDYIVCSLNTEDTVDDIPDSQLLDSPKNVQEYPSFHGDQQDVCHSEDDVESTSISHLDPVHLSEGKITCILNTEDSEIPCNDNIGLPIHSSPCVRPETATESIDPASSFSLSHMDGPNLSSEYDSANQHVGYTLKSVSMDHNPSISDHKNSDSDSDLPFFPDIEDPAIPCNDNIFLLIHQSPSVRQQTAPDSIGQASSFTQAPMGGPGLSSEFDSENRHDGCTLKSVSVDHNPSISDHNNSESDSDLPCFPGVEDPEIPSPSVRPQTATDSIDPASSLTQSQMDGPGLSSEFDSANQHVGCTLKSVSMDHNPSISDHNNSDSDSDLPCFPGIEDPEIASPSVRPQTATDSVDPASCFTQSQMDDPGLSSEFDSANPHLRCTPISVSMDHNPSISDHNNDSELPCVSDTKDPEILSPSFRPQTTTDSIDPTSCFTRSQMDDPDLSSEIDDSNLHVGCTLKPISMDHNHSISDHNSDNDLLCFPDIEDPEIPSPSVRRKTAIDSIDPASSFTQSQMDGPDLLSEFNSAHPHVDNTLNYVSVDHNPSISDHNNSDSDSDLPCLPDLEALILKLDFEYSQDSWITNEVKRGKYKFSKRTINSLQQSSSQRAMSSLGAFAVFYSHHYNYYIKKTEVTIGRSTDDTEVDIDLKKESHANLISRQQATIKMEPDGTFTLTNTGKGSVLVKGIPIAHGKVAALGSSCLIQIRGMNFYFEMNDKYVRWYLDNIMKKTQGKFTTLEWSVN